MSNVDIKELTDMAKRMRIEALTMAYEAGKSGAHLGGGLSCIEILAVLYGQVARFKPDDPAWEDRDRILISKAHAVLAYYTALYEAGFLTKEELFSFEKEGTDFVGHPQKRPDKGIEYAGGSLGMALSVACGMAVHARDQKSVRRIFCLLGDGECEEGSIWEAVMFAAKERLGNLVVIVDRNKLQYDGTTSEVAGLDHIGEKFECFGWNKKEIDGHNISELIDALKDNHIDMPTVIIADTVKGKGVSFMENDPLWHHSVLSEVQYKQALSELDCEGLNAGD